MIASGNAQSMIPGPNGAPSHVTPSPGSRLMSTPAAASHAETTSFNVRENTSFHGMELSTPAAKEGFRVEAMRPSKSHVKLRQQPVVGLTPAACKYLHAFATRLFVIAHHQQYEPQAVFDYDQQHDAMPHLAKVQ